MALNIKKGDNVLVIAGKDKGKSGKVLVAMPADNSVVVAGVNMISKHKKPRSAQDKGGIIKKEGKINASNVQIVCPVCGKATRVAHTIKDDKKIRECKKCGANLDVVVKKEPKKTTKETTKKEVDTESKTAQNSTDKKTTSKSTTTKTATKAEETTKTATKSTTAKSTSTAKKSTSKKVESK